MKMMFCENCNEYTLKCQCPRCGCSTRSAHPARFSPEDKDSKQRILIKEKNGLLLHQRPDYDL